jgi:hypothetical protein
VVLQVVLCCTDGLYVFLVCGEVSVAYNIIGVVAVFFFIRVHSTLENLIWKIKAGNRVAFCNFIRKLF